MAEVPREAFVPPQLAEAAYGDVALPIAAGQTISQPFVVGLMLEGACLAPTDRVLEVGTGSGYAAAVMSRIVSRVYTIERHATLAADASERLRGLGYGNVAVLHGDGTLGWQDMAPFDAIVVAAGGPGQPPAALLAQLKVGGRLVIPTGSSRDAQELLVFERLDEAGNLTRRSLGDVRFVPLVGAGGWDTDDA
jgi:protein-L-isoaspartate(D-aspartate) O-methyltransferase